MLFAVNGHMTATAFFVFLGILFDFFDGLLARKLKVQSELGLQLDSLADMITSGLVPGLVMFHLLSLTVNDFSLAVSLTEYFEMVTTFTMRYDSQPPSSLKSLDTSVSFGFNLKLSR